MYTYKHHIVIVAGLIYLVVRLRGALRYGQLSNTPSDKMGPGAGGFELLEGVLIYLHVYIPIYIYIYIVIYIYIYICTHMCIHISYVRMSKCRGT